jgi:hypothetical protein
MILQKKNGDAERRKNVNEPAEKRRRSGENTILKMKKVIESETADAQDARGVLAEMVEHGHHLEVQPLKEKRINGLLRAVLLCHLLLKLALLTHMKDKKIWMTMTKSSVLNQWSN